MLVERRQWWLRNGSSKFGTSKSVGRVQKAVIASQATKVVAVAIRVHAPLGRVLAVSQAISRADRRRVAASVNSNPIAFGLELPRTD